MADQKHSSSVDDILETLKQGQSAPASGSSVEDILADLGLEQGKPAPAPRTTQNFWQEPAPVQKKQRSQPNSKQAPAKAAPPPEPEPEQPTAPRLSDTIQLDSDFQKFFSESVAVIPDLEQEQHPGFFARFVKRKKNAQPQEDEEELSAQEDYATALDTDDGEPDRDDQEDQDEPQKPKRRRFGFWHKWNEDGEDEEEEDEEDEEQDEPEQTETDEPQEPAPARPVRSPFRRQRRAVEEEQSSSGTVELPNLEQTPIRTAPSVDRAPTRSMDEPAKTLQPPVGAVEIAVDEGPTVDDAPTKTAPEPAAQPRAEKTQEMAADQPAEDTGKTVVLRPEELELGKSPTGSVQLDVEWDNQPGADDTQVVEQKDSDKGAAPRLLGDEAPGQPFDEEPGPEYVEDYENPADAPLVQQDLDRLRLTTAIRTGVSAVAGVILLYLGISVGDSPLPAIGAVDPSVAPLAYLAVNLVLLLVACAVNWRVFWNGIRGLWGAPTPDSVLALAGVGAAAQLLVLLMKADAFEADKLTLFAAPAALLLCFGALGKYLMSGVISRNFGLVSAGNEHVAAFRLEDEELCSRLADGLGEPEPCLVASRPTTLVEGFLRRSFSVRASDRMLQRMSWVLAGVALLAALIALFTKQGLAMAFTAFAGTLCLGGPTSATLLAAVPGMLMQKSAARVGAVVPGWSSIEELSSANMIVVGAKDLFPAKSVRLHGIKTFEKQRIDLAILYAASVLIEGCDTLRDVFMNIIQGKTSILFPVESLENDPGFGFTAWVKDKRVIIGNRAMMEKQGVEIPSLDYENRYTKGKKQPIYLAVSGRLFGMFLVSYKANEQAAHVLEALNRQGVSVLVQSDDFSLTTQLISQVYGLEEGCVKVLSGAERHALAPVTAYQQYSPGCMAHIGSFASFVGGLLAAAGAASAERTSSLVQAAGILVSVVLALLLAFTGGLAALALPALVLYQAAWAVLTLMIPMLKRYE